MKAKILCRLLAALLPLCAVVAFGQRAAEAETVRGVINYPAADAFVALPQDYVDLLDSTARATMVQYFREDSVHKVLNAMAGQSEIMSMTPDYIKVRLTDVSTIELRLLPSERDTVLATVYTIDNGVGAPDSELRFYTMGMTQIPLEKILREPGYRDLFPAARKNKKVLREVEALMPFPTIEFSLSPDSTALTGRLTVGKYMTEEEYRDLKPYIGPDLVYEWTGRKYRLRP